MEMHELLKGQGFEMEIEDYDEDTHVIKSNVTGRRHIVRKDIEQAKVNITLIRVIEG